MRILTTSVFLSVLLSIPGAWLLGEPSHAQPPLPQQKAQQPKKILPQPKNLPEQKPQLRQSIVPVAPLKSSSEMEVSRFLLSVVDPSSATAGTEVLPPGFRGTNQLVLYDSAYAKPTTGTNEFGFEVTVQNGRVVEQEGSDSKIPPQNGYVLSGHGTARAWLLAHAPLGAHIDLDVTNKTMTSRIEYDTYRYQTLRRIAVAQDFLGYTDRHRLYAALDRMDELSATGQGPAAIALAQDTMNWLDRLSWRRANVYPANATRGIWHRPVEKNAEAIEATVSRLQKAGLNTIFLETFYHGYPIFPSKVYLQDGIADNQYPAFKGWDPLAAWVRIAHAHGMKLHVWFQSYYVGTDAVSGLGPILKRHPDWANVQYSAITKPDPQPSTLEKGAYFADPANPQARYFLLSLLNELVDHYPVDGVQLDYMDYPMSFPPDQANFLQTTWGYSAYARKDFMARTGVDPVVLTPGDTTLWPQWTSYKEQQVNAYMEQAAQVIRKKHPNVQISATAFAKLLESKVKKHEDWALWAEKGWIDFLAPMLLTSSVKVVQSDTEFVRATSQDKVPVVSGLFSPFNGSGPETLMDQVVAAKRGGASGFSIFDTAHLDENHRQALQTAFGRAPVAQAPLSLLGTTPPISPTPVK
jgi:uncharacterized lipoprotein YddW (UPF0748 family)